MQAQPENGGLVRRFLNLFRRNDSHLAELDLLTEQQFQRHVQKERLRMLRRGIGFCVVVVRSENRLTKQQYVEFLKKIVQRVRQTDEIGRYQGQLAVLLADTDIDGGRLVSNHLMAEGNSMGIEIDTEVLYPGDFPASGSDAFVPNTNFSPENTSQSAAGPETSRSNFSNRVPINQSGNLSDTPQDSVSIDSAGVSAYSNERSNPSYQSDSTYSSTEMRLGEILSSEVPREIESVEVEGQIKAGETQTGTAVLEAPEELSMPIRTKIRPTLVSPIPYHEIPATPLGSPKSIKTPMWKRAMDIVGSSIGLTLFSPLLAATALAIRWESKGGAFFTQLREGKDGKRFRILKFRTMVVDAEEQKAALRKHSEQDGPAFKMTDDPRVTKIGKVLRKTCVDELPQLWNVLKGEMSLVGPRPLPVDESEACCQWQRRRLDVLPGLTCLWQVQDQREIPFSDWMRLDLQYMKERSFLGDWALIFKTIWVAVRVKGSV